MDLFANMINMEGTINKNNMGGRAPPIFMTLLNKSIKLMFTKGD